MSAFEEAHFNKLRELTADEESGQPSQRTVDYLLDVGRLVRDFYVNPQVSTVPRPKEALAVTRRPRKRRERTAVEKSGTVQKFAEVTNTHREGAMYKAYTDHFGSNSPTEHVTNQMVTNTQGWFCETCEVALLLDRQESCVVCPECGLCDHYMEGGPSNLTYDQEMSMATNSNSPYVRMNHLNEILAQVQGKEMTQVPDWLLTKLKVEFKKDAHNGVVRASDVTPKRVYGYLQKLGYSEWVSHHGAYSKGIHALRCWNANTSMYTNPKQYARAAQASLGIRPRPCCVLQFHDRYTAKKDTRCVRMKMATRAQVLMFFLGWEVTVSGEGTNVAASKSMDTRS